MIPSGGGLSRKVKKMEDGTKTTAEETFSFSQALHAMRGGSKFRRLGWHQKDKFIWIKPASKIKAEWCKDPMLKSLAEKNGGEIFGMEAICMYLTENGTPMILTGWHPTPCDLMHDDWVIVL